MPLNPQKLLKRLEMTLKRDIRHVHAEACKGKLSPSSAKDLATYYKLVKELCVEEDQAKKTSLSASTAELEALAKKLLNEKTSP